MNTKSFHICTIANKLKQYDEMKASFIEAGFDENRCRYSLFDNSNGNVYEPYETFNQIKSDTLEPYIVFCHQDVIINQGDGFNSLIKVIEELEKLDSKWAIAGNAGLNKNYEIVAKITDPCTPNWTGDFPHKVHSLDENFFVVKTSANIKCSQELDGFHFYATDLCLNAIVKGYSCYVINFHLTHLSSGNFSQAFYKAQTKFYEKWCSQFNFCYVQTTCTAVMVLSKYKIFRYLGSRNKVMKLLLSRHFFHPLVSPY
ncbi:MAG: hypothetical protein KME29_23395 [Calothrix sp. FI2-JRJ7]|jgi:hypothetical protein|nr:hypothetical protein [Calothrix sp. FI2-JRJ7]